MLRVLKNLDSGSLDDVADSEKLAAESDIGAYHLKGVEVMLGFQGEVLGDRHYPPVLVYTVSATSTDKTYGKARAVPSHI